MTSNHFDPYNKPGPKHVYATNTKPAKIDLLNDEPRRCGLDENRSFGGHQQVDYEDQQATSSSNVVHQYGNSYGSEPQINALGSSSLAGPPHGAAFDSPHSTMTKTVTTTITEQITTKNANDLDELEKRLMEKEAALKRELAYLNQYSNPWSRPKQVREPRKEPGSRASSNIRTDSKWVKECPSTPSSRPTSRGSNSRPSVEADLMEKAEKLLKDVEEWEMKPLNKQQIIIEAGTKRSLPTSSVNENVESVHTAIIKVPTREIDNKSPLPFAYDNFSTLGVRGNIASVGAAPPDQPYAPIFPTIKRTPSPTSRYGRQ